MEHTAAHIDARTKDGYTALELARCQAVELDVIYSMIRDHGLWDRVGRQICVCGKNSDAL